MIRRRVLLGGGGVKRISRIRRMHKEYRVVIESERMSDSRLYLLGSSVVYYRRTFLPHRDCVNMRRDSMYVGTYIYVYSTYTYYVL